MLGGMTLVFLISTSALAANVFEEQDGRFAIDLPDGMTLNPQKYALPYGRMQRLKDCLVAIPIDIPR